MSRWYEHRFHNTTALRLIFVIMPRLPRLLHPPVAAVTALIFFLVLKRERRAVTGNLRRRIDCSRRTLIAPERAEIVHGAAAVKKGVVTPICSLGDADDLAEAANIVGFAGGATEDQPMSGRGQWAYCVDGARGELGIRVATSVDVWTS